MNKAISWKKDEHFSGEGKEYSCTNAYVKYESAMVGVTDDNGEVVEVDMNDSDFDFIFDNNTRKNETDKVAKNNCRLCGTKYDFRMVQITKCLGAIGISLSRSVDQVHKENAFKRCPECGRKLTKENFDGKEI